MRVCTAQRVVLGLLLASLLAGGSHARELAAQGQPSLRDVAAHFVRLTGDDERRTWLEAHPELVSPDGRTALVSIADTLARQRRLDESWAAYQAILWLGNATNQDRIRYSALAGFGNVSGRRGALRESVEWSERALTVARSLADPQLIQQLGTNLGIAYRGLGDLDRAKAYAEEALRLAQQLKLRPQESRAWNTVGLIFAARGQMAQAHDAFSRSLELKDDDGGTGTEDIINTLNNLGGLYSEVGDLSQATAYFRRAIETAERLGPDRAVLAARPLSNLGNTLIARGDLAEARRTLARAQVLAERGRDAALYATILYNLGNISRDEGRSDEAFALHQQSLAMREQGGDVDGQSQNLVELGKIERTRGRMAEAGALLDRALALATTAGLPAAIARAQTYRGELFEAQRRLGDALIAYEAAIEAVEALRRQTPDGDAARQMFLAWRLAPYLGVAGIRAQQGRGLDALAAVERARARTLIDIVAAGGPAARSRTAAQGMPQLTAGQLASLLRPGTAIAAFVIEPTRTWVYLIKGGAQGPDVQAHRLPVESTALSTVAARVADGIAARDLGFASTARELYGLLFGAHESWLKDVRQLILVPDGVLWRVPFQALPSADGRYLVERMTVSYAPSVSALVALRARQTARPAAPSPHLLALGDPLVAGTPSLPRLPESAREVEALGRIYGPAHSTVLTGAAATIDALKAGAPRAGVVHIATHGELDDVTPMFSHLALAGGDGRLEAREVVDIPLEADLVVLSACETARGRLGGGEGIIGLSWSLFAAGASSVVVSQWAVDSASTTTLMIGFHERWRTAGQDRTAAAEALRGAARAVMADPRYRHPFYWAGFVLIGK